MIAAAARSAIRMVGVWMFPEIMIGITEASAMLRTLSLEACVQFAPGQSVTLAWTTAMPRRNGAPFTLAAARPDSRCGLPVQVNPN